MGAPRCVHASAFAHMHSCTHTATTHTRAHPQTKKHAYIKCYGYFAHSSADAHTADSELAQFYQKQYHIQFDIANSS